MINYIVELSKELERRPTEEEIAKKMQEILSMNHDKLNGQTKRNKVTGHMASQKVKDEANAHRLKDSIEASPRVRTINILMHYNLNAKQIANALNLTVRTVRDTVHRYKLPRAEIRPIKGKSKDIVGA
jgi:DNA-binding NarL/FixJ family response regulator